MINKKLSSSSISSYKQSMIERELTEDEKEKNMIIQEDMDK